MMSIIGNGLIARALRKYNFPHEVVVVAAGVSNSNETRESEFDREISLLEETLSTLDGKKIIYFSTCSIYQFERSNYIDHKLRAESLIRSKSECYQIYRLPQVVGGVLNSTLISYFVKNIKEGNKIKLQASATRNLIDVEDVAKATFEFIHLVDNLDNSVVNFGTPKSVLVSEIALEVSRALGKPLLSEEVCYGSTYDIPVDTFLNNYSRANVLQHPEYWRKVIHKYVPEISSLL